MVFPGVCEDIPQIPEKNVAFTAFHFPFLHTSLYKWYTLYVFTENN